MNLAKIAIKRPTFIMALLMAFIILGTISLSNLSVRMFPDVEFPYVLIMTTYPGAGVAEIEQLVSKPIEDAVSGVSALKHVNSINQDNVSIVFCEFQLSKDPDIATQEVRDKIGQIRLNLPDDVKEPVIIKADINSLPIGTVSLKAKGLTPKQMYDFADDVVSKDLSQVSGVSQINIIGGQKREIHINADKKKLKNYELTLTSLAAKIKLNSLNIPAGKVNRGVNEVEFRTLGEFKSISQINNVVVNFLGNDKHVIVGDVATVEDGVEKEVSRARIDIIEDGKFVSEPALLLQVYRQAKGNDVAISNGLKKKIEEVNQKYLQYDGRPQLTMISDAANGVRMNIENVKSTIIEGVFLAVVVVYFFLASWRSTFITALSLPNSLIGSFVFMYTFGFSLNVLSLMALSLAVGLLIDDAIVVRENIFRHYQEGANPIKAALDGTNEVTLAVIATTSTVVAVFLPVAFLSGVMGQFFKEFGLTVVFAMLISILDALTIAPLLSAYMIPDHNAKKVKKWKIQEVVIKLFRSVTVDWFNKSFNVLERSYKKLLSFIVEAKVLDFKFGKNNRHFSVSWKFATLTIAIFVFVFTIGLSKKYLKATFMPAAEWGEFNINLQAKPGTSLDQMDKYTKEVEQILMNDQNIELISVAVGQSGMFSSLASQASIYVRMIPADSHGGFFGLFGKKEEKDTPKRTRSSSQMKDYLREVFEEKFKDELEVSIVRQSVGGHSESEFVMQLNGADIDVLYDVAQTLIKRFKEIPHFVDVCSNYKVGKPEAQIQMDPKKMEDYGVSSVVVGNEVRAMVDGVLAGKFREHGLEYDIKVRFAQDQQDIAQNLDTIYVNNVNNKLVKLKNVASIKMAEGPTQIFREDRVRYVSVEGNLAAGGAIGEIQTEAIRIFNEEKTKPENLEKWKHVHFGLSGNAEDMAEMFKSIIIAAGLSIIFIFMVLASLYESVITPFTIMTALPLAIIGGLFALLIARQPIDMFTLIGMIMLLGIVAKNSILLVDYVQQQMRNGLTINDAIVKAGIVRLRPILMTSFALIAGMLPTALGLSEVGQFRRGMGIVVIGGVISSTILTLIVVPAIFEYMDNFRLFLRKLVKRPAKRMIDYTEEELHKQDL
ncbi:MAG: efflux RND transporter permease subunit [Endomicrobium sp.]|jgi:hydrophobe/amphiphile efflux-1 (HAE1) family protein|nr:efflux RND transporter permease subunit [Endomicrobium sp.]